MQLKKKKKSIHNLLEFIPRGCWCIVMMNQEGNLDLDSNEVLDNERPYVRFVGYIDRVAAVSSLSGTGAFDALIEITGKDHGCIYEKTDVWLDSTVGEKLSTKPLLQSVNMDGNTRRLDRFIKKFHDLVYHPKLEPSMLKLLNARETDSLLTTGNQWILPAKLVSDLEIPMRNRNDGPRWGNLDVINNSRTLFWYFGTTVSEVYASANMWTKLKSLSCSVFNELFTEVDAKGIPQLIYRPIPFAINKSKYELLRGAFPYYVDLAKTKDSNVLIDRHELLGFNVGYDDASLSNSFKLELKTDLLGLKELTAYYVDSVRNKYNFPRHYKNSIVRHGLRRLHPTLHKITIQLIAPFLKLEDLSFIDESSSKATLNDIKKKINQVKVLNLAKKEITNAFTKQMKFIKDFTNTGLKSGKSVLSAAAVIGLDVAPKVTKLSSLEQERDRKLKAAEDSFRKEANAQSKKIDAEIKSLKQNIDLLKSSDAQTSLKYLINMNNVVTDFWQYNVLSKSGTISLIGRTDMRLGKVMTFNKNLNLPYLNSDDIYYIEGYTDAFEVDSSGTSTWTQRVMVSRGFNRSVLNKVKGDNLSNEPSPNMRLGGLASSTQQDSNYGRFDPKSKPKAK